MHDGPTWHRSGPERFADWVERRHATLFLLAAALLALTTLGGC